MPRIGFTMTTANFPDYPSEYKTSFITGFVTGAEGRFVIKDRFGMAIDLNLSQKGWEADITTQGSYQGGIVVGPSTSHSKVRLFYGELMCLPNFSVSNFYFLAGPGLSYGLGGKYFVSGTYVPTGQTVSNVFKLGYTDDDSNEPFIMDKRWTLSVNLGVGMALWERLLVELRYQVAPVEHFREKTNPDPLDNSGVYNSVQLSCSLKLFN